MRRMLHPEKLEARCMLAAGPLLHTHNVDELAVVDASTGEIEVLSTMTGFSPNDDRMADIAFSPEGRLYGVTRDWLYEIHPVTAELTVIGEHGIANANALTFDRTGNLLAMNRSSADLFRLNLVGDTLQPTTRAATLTLDDGVGSNGDISFIGGDLVVANNRRSTVVFPFRCQP